ncbi:hypothetical protein [Naasia lichenicola]|uniref:Uncharacterized protein n=1 Tax=Naasia lichenicola TaxID=2565933 RepID=A0A4S4FRF9_9MICO|nr:hypothetical protein [Naasia lichenicola]THG32954.1 hypothetical protein E6C64_00855 [Naasia lichenicola]
MTITDIDQTDIEEYNAFGPWIADVASVDQVPRVFRRLAGDPADATLALKIPRDIARRDARPGMDLFDRLLLVRDDTLTVLTRSAQGVDEETIPLGEISAFEDSVDLLDGRLVIHASDGTMSVPYNGSSRAQMHRLIDVLRPPRPELSVADDRLAAPARIDALTELGQADVGLGADFRELQRREPGSVLLAAHGRRILAPPPGPIAALTHRFRPATLHAAVVYATPSELHVLHRRVQLARGGKPTLSSAHTIVVRSAIRSVSVHPHPEYPEVSAVTVAVAGSRIELLVPHGSTAEQALERLG